jgi:hypothetical protein
MADKLNVQGLSDSEIQRLHKELDINKDGQVNIEEFVSTIIDVTSLQKKTSFKVFFDKINKAMTSKAEMILNKLNILKKTANKESLEHLEW